MQSTETKMLNRIYGHGRGWAFSKMDFMDISSDGAIRQTLMRLEDKGTIRRILRGLYDYPQFSDLLKETLGPDLDQAAHALARKFGWRIQPSGNTALNLLGLSTQIPAQAVYLSDGPTKTYSMNKQELTFRKRTLKESGFKHHESELLVQAFKELGRERIDAKLCAKLHKSISNEKWPQIVKDTRSATSWIYDAIRTIAGEFPS
jgi:hypothetical protein